MCYDNWLEEPCVTDDSYSESLINEAVCKMWDNEEYQNASEEKQVAMVEAECEELKQQMIDDAMEEQAKSRKGLDY